MLTLVSTIIIIQFENNLFGTRITNVFNSEKKEESFISKKNFHLKIENLTSALINILNRRKYLAENKLLLTKKTAAGL